VHFTCPSCRRGGACSSEWRCGHARDWFNAVASYCVCRTAGASVTASVRDRLSRSTPRVHLRVAFTAQRAIERVRRPAGT
jgi:hypothetical protein